MMIQYRTCGDLFLYLLLLAKTIVLMTLCTSFDTIFSAINVARGQRSTRRPEVSVPNQESDNEDDSRSLMDITNSNSAYNNNNEDTRVTGITVSRLRG